MATSSQGQSFVGGRFRLVKKIDSGAHGEIYEAIDVTKKEEVAVKMESISSGQNYLKQENECYRKLEGGEGFPHIRWYGEEGGYRVLVMDMLGPSLLVLLIHCKGRFTLKTVLMLADQMIQRIEYVHTKGIVHRDIKPENFLMHTNKLYLIDFGLAKNYRNALQQHVPLKDGKNFVGTLRYAPINAHRGLELSRRDDLESLGYVLVYLLRGYLPWMGLKAVTDEKRSEKIKKSKESTSLEDLCKDCPLEFQTYIQYCKDLSFEADPDYGYLRGLFRTVFQKMKYNYDFVYGWTPVQQQRPPATAGAAPRKK